MIGHHIALGADQHAVEQQVARPVRVSRIGAEGDVAAVFLRFFAQRLSFRPGDFDGHAQHLFAGPRVPAHDRLLVEAHEVLRAREAVGPVDQVEHVVEVGLHLGAGVLRVANGPHDRLDGGHSQRVLAQRHAFVVAVRGHADRVVARRGRVFGGRRPGPKRQRQRAGRTGREYLPSPRGLRRIVPVELVTHA